VRNTKPQGKDKERKRKKTPRNVKLDRPNNDLYSSGGIYLSNPVSMSYLQRDTNGYKKLVSTSSPRTKPNF